MRGKEIIEKDRLILKFLKKKKLLVFVEGVDCLIVLINICKNVDVLGYIEEF